MKAGFHWICEIARCCGRKYVRKRLPDRPFRITDQRCFACGRALGFVPPPRDPRQVKHAERNRYQQRRNQNLQAGHTAHGTPKIRFALPPTEAAWRELRAEMGEIKTAEIIFGLDRHAA